MIRLIELLLSIIGYGIPVIYLLYKLFKWLDAGNEKLKKLNDDLQEDDN